MPAFFLTNLTWAPKILFNPFLLKPINIYILPRSMHTSIVVIKSVLARDAESGRSLPELGRCLDGKFGHVSFVPSIVTSSCKSEVFCQVLICLVTKVHKICEFLHCYFQGVDLTPKRDLKKKVQNHSIFGVKFTPVLLTPLLE